MGMALLRRGDGQGAAGRRGNRSQSHGQSKKGAKRSLLCEGGGVPVGLEAAGANVNDFKLLRSTIESVLIERPEPSEEREQGLCLDKGYDYPEVYGLAREFGFTAHIRARGDEAEAIKLEQGFRARRWVVERTHSWLNRFRGLLVRWSKKAKNHRALLQFASGLITWRMATAKDLPG